MKSSDIIPFNSHDSEVKQLHREITSYVATLDTNIKDEEGSSYIVLQYKIDRWQDKKAVLEVALLCLSGEKLLIDLNTATSHHSHWNDKDGWWQCETEIFVNKVTTLLTKPGLTASFFFSCFTNHFNSLLPNDIQLYLLDSFLFRPADVIAFAMTSKTNWGFFKKNTSITFLPSLLDHVALGEYEAAEKLYPKYQGMLLTKKGSSSYHLKLDLPRYQYVGLTPFQIALRNAEWTEAEKMGQHLSPEEKQKQCNEIFPNGELVSYGCNLETAKKLLQDVYDAIIVDDVINENDLDLMTEKTRNVLKQLWDAINPANHACQIGLVFDVQIYLEALGLYNENFNTFETWDRRSFWCVRVEELIASVLPTIYLRAHCLGIGNVVNGDIVAWDKLSGRGCLLADGSSYFNRSSNNLPGVHFFVGYYGLRHARWGRPGGGWSGGPMSFKTYVEQQRDLGQTLCSNISTPTHRLA